MKAKLNAYRVIVAVLAWLVLWETWTLWQLRRQLFTAGFINFQASKLSEDLESADWLAGKATNLQDHLEDREERRHILYSLEWYLNYFDHRTNSISDRDVRSLIYPTRTQLINRTIRYLRATSTHDFGDDPRVWLREELPSN